MDRYKKYQCMASVCVAVFILSAALCILVMDRKVFALCMSRADNMYAVSAEADAGTETDASGIGTTDGVVMSEFEIQMNYRQLADDFSSFWKNKYEISGYELTAANTDKLNHLKWYYRFAWIFAVFSFAGAVYCFVILSKRRLYMPFLYGGALAAFLTSIQAVVLMVSDAPVASGLRRMILQEDYSYFSEGDILRTLFPPEFARYQAFAYLLIVFGLILLMALIRGIIVFRGRPHRF